MKIIYQWIRNDISKKQKKDEKLFKIGISRWTKILYKVSERVVDKKIHPHTLRHSTATWLLGQGWELNDIAQYLGHDSIVTTQIYAHVSQERLEDKYKKIV